MVTVYYRLGNAKKIHKMVLNVGNTLEAGVILQKALKKKVTIVWRQRNEVDESRERNLQEI